MKPVTLPDVSTIIVSFNTQEMTLACIRSALQGAPAYKQQLIVIDNASNDGSADAIAAEFPDVVLIRSPDNLGFAKANNVAAKHADGEFILLLNPDTVVLGKATEDLINFAKANPKAGIWGGRTFYGDMTLNPNSWRFMSLWILTVQIFGLPNMFSDSPLFNPEAYGGWKHDTVREVDIVVGSFLLIEREFWERLGGFDELFFMYAEEADLCFRARQLGARPSLTPDSTIVHYGGASETVRASKMQRLYTGKCTFIRKHWPGWKSWLGIALLKCHVLVRVAGYGLADKLLRKPQYETAKDEWLKVWQERKVWTLGYTT